MCLLTKRVIKIKIFVYYKYVHSISIVLLGNSVQYNSLTVNNLI